MQSDQLIKSISYDEGEIIRGALKLHGLNSFIHYDPTYSIGSIYKRAGLPEPMIKSDINPQEKGVEKIDVRNTPFDDGSMRSILFDPPFIDGKSPGASLQGKIHGRFDSFDDVAELWTFYKDSLKELYRILHPKGILLFKCQDITSEKVNNFSHCYILNAANKTGFYAKDLFILLAKNRIQSNWKTQMHARKFHCYYWVFNKQKIKVVNHFLGL